MAQLTVDDIEKYEQSYRGSAEEERDLKELYKRFDGDMKQCARGRSLLHVPYAAGSC